MEVTERFAGFLDTRHRPVDQTQHILSVVLTKVRSWQCPAATPLNERQMRLLKQMPSSAIDEAVLGHLDQDIIAHPERLQPISTEGVRRV